MLYAFGDESYPAGTGGREATYLVIAVRQDRFRSKAAELSGFLHQYHGKPKRRQRELLRTLRGAGAVVILGKLDAPESLVKSVKAFEAPDVGRISPRAAIWSCLFGFTCSVALFNTVGAGTAFSCVDFFYDPNKLSDPHEETTHRTMRQVLQRQLAELSSSHFGVSAPRPKLRHIKPVPKYPAEYSPQHVQLGVRCADEIQTFSLRSREEADHLGVEVRDFTGSFAMMVASGTNVHGC